MVLSKTHSTLNKNKKMGLENRLACAGVLQNIEVSGIVWMFTPAFAFTPVFFNSFRFTATTIALGGGTYDKQRSRHEHCKVPQTGGAVSE